MRTPLSAKKLRWLLPVTSLFCAQFTMSNRAAANDDEPDFPLRPTKPYCGSSGGNGDRCVVQPNRSSQPYGGSPSWEPKGSYESRRSTGAMVGGLVLIGLGTASLAASGIVAATGPQQCSVYRGDYYYLRDVCGVAYRNWAIGLAVGGGATTLVGLPLTIWGASRSSSVAFVGPTWGSINLHPGGLNLTLSF